MTDLASTGVTDSIPLEVKKINRHQKKIKERSLAGVKSTDQHDFDPEYGRVSAQKADDEPTRTEFESGKDELKAIYLAKTGQLFRISDLDAIESLLVDRSVTWEAFATDARGHSWGQIKNPVGFLKNRAKNFQALNRQSNAPVTAREAADRDYKCSLCASRVRGEGAYLVDGKSVPCACASPEYVERVQARGIFDKEPPK